ncbi:MAG: serine/threonine protein kinase [Sandaracinaceae bacterium]|nr:serine/threonine protein kinase [Sandaracinaceae bacterium]
MLSGVPSSYIGREIADQFRIVERIGAGGMGSVYRAEQPEMNRSVAIKILHSKYLSRADLVSRFRREARAMSHLSHPNTARVFLYGQLEDGACYFVMEYLEGHNLAQEVRRNGPVDVARALRIMVQVAGALEEAHRAGIIHRDLKPENIFLTTQGGIPDFPKVLDFGLAKVSEKQLAPGSMMLTREGMVFGTPEFMSPEQAQGQTLDGRSDIYSLGIILYELLTGKLPFEAKTSMEFIKHQVATTPIPISARVPGLRFPRSVEAIIERALAKKPAHRFGSAAEMAAAMQAALDESHLWESDARDGAAGSGDERDSDLPTRIEVDSGSEAQGAFDDDPLPGVPVGWIVIGLAVAIGAIGGLMYLIG